MYNPITFVKDVIDLLRNPKFEPVAALEITLNNRTWVIAELGPRSEKYAKIGDFIVELENTMTIVPAQEFHERYAFAAVPQDDEHMTVIVAKKPL